MVRNPLQKRHGLLALVGLLAAGCTSAADPGGKKPNPGPTDPAEPTDVFPEINPPYVVINEVMAGNESTINGTDGYSTPDYVELVNLGTEDVPLSRLELTSDDGSWVGRADHVLAAGERVLVYFDVAADEVGHWAGYGLDKDEDEITLLGDGYPIDEVTVFELASDVAFARTPDVTGEFVATAWPTPGLPNGAEPSPTLNPADETLFVTDRVHEIRFTFTPEAYNKINESDRPEVPVEVSIDGVAYAEVGLGLKGSASYDTMDGKPAFKLDLNAYVLGTRFREQRALGLHNGVVLDPTRTRDHLSYGLAREAGILAPRVGWAEVWANDAYLGIYMIIERFEEEFIEYRRPGHGELGIIFEGNETQAGGWASDFGDGNVDFDMEEGPVPPPVEAMASVEAVNAIVGGPSTDEKVAELWNYLNKEQFLKYMAWEAVVHHSDGYKSPNNWRFYVDPVTFKLEWVPSGVEWTWDFDPQVYSFGGNVADFCVDNTGCKYDYSVEVLAMADLADSMDLLTTFDELSATLDPFIKIDDRYEDAGSWDTVSDARASTAEHLVTNPHLCRQEVYANFPALAP